MSIFYGLKKGSRNLPEALGFLLCGIKNYLTNSNSLYFGNGHNSLSTINSNLSIW